MRNLSFLVLLGLVGAACGGDGGTKKQDGGAGDGGMDGGGDGVTIPDGGGVKYPECPRERVPPFDNSDPATHVWTEENLIACSDACGSLTGPDLETCLLEKCPGIELYAECVYYEARACLTAPPSRTSGAGGCHSEWENYVCCADHFCADASDDEVVACEETNCASEIEAVLECFDVKESRQTLSNQCPSTAQDICLSGEAPLVDGGIDNDAGTDGGTKSKSRSAGITRVDRAQMRALRLNLFKLPPRDLLKLKK